MKVYNNTVAPLKLPSHFNLLFIQSPEKVVFNLFNLVYSLDHFLHYFIVYLGGVDFLIFKECLDSMRLIFWPFLKFMALLQDVFVTSTKVHLTFYELLEEIIPGRALYFLPPLHLKNLVYLNLPFCSEANQKDLFFFNSLCSTKMKKMIISFINQPFRALDFLHLGSYLVSPLDQILDKDPSTKAYFLEGSSFLNLFRHRDLVKYSDPRPPLLLFSLIPLYGLEKQAYLLGFFYIAWRVISNKFELFMRETLTEERKLKKKRSLGNLILEVLELTKYIYFFIFGYLVFHYVLLNVNGMLIRYQAIVVGIIGLTVLVFTISSLEVINNTRRLLSLIEYIRSLVYIRFSVIKAQKRDLESKLKIIYKRYCNHKLYLILALFFFIIYYKLILLIIKLSLYGIYRSYVWLICKLGLTNASLEILGFNEKIVLTVLSDGGLASYCMIQGGITYLLLLYAFLFLKVYIDEKAKQKVTSEDPNSLLGWYKTTIDLRRTPLILGLFIFFLSLIKYDYYLKELILTNTGLSTISQGALLKALKTHTIYFPIFRRTALDYILINMDSPLWDSISLLMCIFVSGVFTRILVRLAVSLWISLMVKVLYRKQKIIGSAENPKDGEVRLYNKINKLLILAVGYCSWPICSLKLNVLLETPKVFLRNYLIIYVVLVAIYLISLNITPDKNKHLLD